MGAEENSTTDDDGVDLEDLVGRVLDSRGITKERLESIDGLPGRIEALLSGAKPVGTPAGNATGTPALDEAGLLDKIGAMVDEKLSVVTQPKAKPLRAWLGI